MSVMFDQSPHQTVPSGHEPIQTNVRAVWITGIVLGGIVAVASLLIFGMQSWLETTQRPQEAKAETAETSITNPNWNVPPQVQQLRTKEQRYLTTYAWVDQSAGVARIPLSRALEIVAEDGLPVAIEAGVNPSTQNSNE